MNVYKGRLLKKSSNRKWKLVLSTLVTTWLPNIAFLLQPIWLQTLVAIHSDLCLTSFPSFCAPPSEVTALFNLNLSRLPFLWQVLDTDLLLCTVFDLEHAVKLFCSYVIYLLRDEWMIERSCLAKQWVWPWLATTSRWIYGIFISHEKKWLVAALNLQRIKSNKDLLALELSRYCKSGSMFPSSEQVAASSDCHRLGNARCLCSLGSGPRYMICVTLFCTLCESENARTRATCKNVRQNLIPRATA